MLGLLILFGFAFALIVLVGTMVIIHYLRHPPRLSLARTLARRGPVEPAELGLIASEHTFRLPDGAKTPAWFIQGSDQSAGAPVILITHGWGDSRVGSLALAPLLAGLARMVIIYDLRAHGESTARRSDLGTTEVDDLLTIIDQIDPALGPIVLYGDSIGAGISIAAAAKEAQRPAPGTRPRRIVGVIGEGVYRWGMEPIYCLFRYQHWPTWPFLWLVGWHLNFWVCRDSLFERARHAARLRCPLLLLHGTADHISPFKSAREIAAAAPDGKLVAFAGGRHLDLAALDPARYLEAVTAFLQHVRQCAQTGSTPAPTVSAAKASPVSAGTPEQQAVLAELLNPKSASGVPKPNPPELSR